jgi:transposase-like protein
MKKEYSFEVIDRCEALYVNEGKTYGEISGTTGVSIPQLQRWGKKYEWRKKKEKFKTGALQANTEARGLDREKVLEDLKKQKERYDKFFGKLGEGQIDIQATYAYSSLCKTIFELQRQRDEKRDPQIFLDFMRDLVSYLKEHDPEALMALEKNFDEFIGFAKQKYA